MTPSITHDNDKNLNTHEEVASSHYSQPLQVEQPVR